MSSDLKIDIAVPFNRNNPVPLDSSEIFENINAAYNYLSTDKSAYIGQIITVKTSEEQSNKINVIPIPYQIIKKKDNTLDLNPIITNNKLNPIIENLTNNISSHINSSVTINDDDVHGIKQYVNKRISDLGTVYTYKGTVSTSAALPSSDVKPGHVYNVEDSGMNFAWAQLSNNISGFWDPLGVTFDPSDLESSIENLKTNLSTVSADLSDTNNEIKLIVNDIESIENNIESIEKDIESIETELSTISNDISDINTNVNKLSSDLSTTNIDVSELSNNLSGHINLSVSISSDVHCVAEYVSAEISALSTSLTGAFKEWELSSKSYALGENTYHNSKSGGDDKSILIGAATSATSQENNYSVVIGSGASTSASGDDIQNRAIAIGQDAKSTINGVAIGAGAITDKTQAVSIGNGVKNYCQGGMAIGSGTECKGEFGSIGIGANLSAHGNSSTVIGAKSISLAPYTIAIGRNVVVNANADNSIAIGLSANVLSSNSIAIGNSTVVSANARDSIAIGLSANVLSSNSIAIGKNTVVSANARDSIAIGLSANVLSSNSIAIGKNANTNSSNSIAIGLSANALGANSIQLGSGNNLSPNTLQFRKYPLVDADGYIVYDRLRNFSDEMLKEYVKTMNYTAFEVWTTSANINTTSAALYSAISSISSDLDSNSLLSLNNALDNIRSNPITSAMINELTKVKTYELSDEISENDKKTDEMLISVLNNALDSATIKSIYNSSDRYPAYQTYNIYETIPAGYIHTTVLWSYKVMDTSGFNIMIDWGDGQLEFLDDIPTIDVINNNFAYVLNQIDKKSTRSATTIEEAFERAYPSSHYNNNTGSLKEMHPNIYNFNWNDTRYAQAIFVSHKYETAGKFIVKVYGTDYFGIAHGEKWNISSERCFSYKRVRLSRCFDYDLPISPTVTSLNCFTGSNNPCLFEVFVPQYYNWVNARDMAGIFKKKSNLQFVASRALKNIFANSFTNIDIKGIFFDTKNLKYTNIRLPNYSTNLNHNGNKKQYLYDYYDWSSAKDSLSVDILTILPQDKFIDKEVIVGYLFKDFKHVYCSDQRKLSTILWGDETVNWLHTTSAFLGCSEELSAMVPKTWGGAMEWSSNYDLATSALSNNDISTAIDSVLNLLNAKNGLYLDGLEDNDGYNIV